MSTIKYNRYAKMPDMKFPRFANRHHWQYEHIVIEGNPESAQWADRRSEHEAGLFAANPALSTGRVRVRVITIEFKHAKDFRGTVVHEQEWFESTVDQSRFDRMTAA
jgi:hypothetical protein